MDISTTQKGPVTLDGLSPSMLDGRTIQSQRSKICHFIVPAPSTWDLIWHLFGSFGNVRVHCKLARSRGSRLWAFWSASTLAWMFRSSRCPSSNANRSRMAVSKSRPSCSASVPLLNSFPSSIVNSPLAPQAFQIPSSSSSEENSSLLACMRASRCCCRRLVRASTARCPHGEADATAATTWPMAKNFQGRCAETTRTYPKNAGDINYCHCNLRTFWNPMSFACFLPRIALKN